LFLESWIVEEKTMKTVIFGGVLLLSATTHVRAQDMSTCSPSRCFAVGTEMGMFDAAHRSAACNGDGRYVDVRKKICEEVIRREKARAPANAPDKKRS
jgi:hypothetical protein